MNREDMIKQAVILMRKHEINEFDLCELIKRFKGYRAQIVSDPKTVMYFASETFEVSSERALSESRDRPLVYARAFYSKYMRSLGIYSYSEIGRQLNRTHASIINAVQNANDWIEFDRELSGKWSVFKYKIDEMNLRLEVE